MRVPRTSGRIRAEIMLRDYERNKREAARMRGEILRRTAPAPEVPLFPSGGDRDDTGRRAAALCDDWRIRRIEQEIEAVDYADRLCRNMRNGDKILGIIALVYRKGTHNIVGAAMKCGIGSPTWAGKLAARYLDLVDGYFRL